MHKTVYLSLGSNVGDRLANLKAAVERLHDVGHVVATSSVYETEPVEFTDQPWFLNCVVEMETEKTPKPLLDAILAIEEEMGRRRGQKKGPRTIDIDILLFDDSIVWDEDMTVPHPSMQNRRFVLEPLAEIAGGVRHPVLKKNIQELKDALPCGQVVRRFSAL